MEFLVFSDHQHPEEKGVFWWNENSTFDPKSEFRGELCMTLGFAQWIGIRSLLSSEGQLPTMDSRLRICFIGRFASDWQEEPIVERGNYFLFDGGLASSVKLPTTLPLSQLLVRLSRKSKLDKPRSPLSPSLEPEWKFVAGTADVLQKIEQQLLLQEHRACHIALLQTLFKLGVSQKELEVSAPGLGRAVKYLMEANTTHLAQLQREVKERQQALDAEMKPLLAAQLPLAALEECYQAWLKKQ